MPLRFHCRWAAAVPGSPLPAHWPQGLHRPRFDVYLLGPGGVTTTCRVHIDTAADFNLFSAQTAIDLGLRLPFPRRQAMSGAGGTHTSGVSFAPPGVVGLFATDYVEYCYLPSPLVAFHDPAPGVTSQRSVLGLTGFLQHFRFVLDHGPAPPAFELHPLAAFPGTSGPLPRDRPVSDFLRDLHGA